MSKSIDLNDLLLRIEDLERSMKIKDAQILNLQIDLRESKQHFIDELAQKNQVIAELSSKLDSNSPSQQNSDPTSSDILPSDSTSAQLTDLPDSSGVQIVEHDLLLIGDSLVRDVDASVLNPGGDTTIVSLPGARPTDVVQKYRQLMANFRFKRVVVHVGSNLVPKFGSVTCSTRIIDCLESIRNLSSPDAKVAFSHVLPKLGDHLLAGINRINRQVALSGEVGPKRTRFGNVPHFQEFTTSSGMVDGTLFTRDGIHLSARGRLAFAKSLNKLIRI